MSGNVLTYTVKARVVGPGVSRGAIDDKTAETEFDTSAGQSKTLPGPADLLHHNIARQGTIFNTLAAACEVTGEVIAVPPASAS